MPFYALLLKRKQKSKGKTCDGKHPEKYAFRKVKAKRKQLFLLSSKNN
jgi:hypothetical protein